MSNFNHPFHLVNYSPWPLTGAIGTTILLAGAVEIFHKTNNFLVLMGLSVVLLTMYQWWRDISRESTFQGFHNKQIISGMKGGMILFIISEGFFFFGFFWSFFHSSLSPTIELGLCWPPYSILSFDPFKTPLLNTIILLTSGISVTWGHHSILNKNYKQSLFSLFFTVVLGIYFSSLQLFEYLEAPFSVADSSYGATFFIATGFHGLHVLIGTTFLLICLIRQYYHHFSSFHHFGFEAAAWYWHFVDVIWLILYLSIYWWGG